MVQNKITDKIRAQIQAQMDLSVAQRPNQTVLGQAIPRCSDKERPETAQPQQLGAVGAAGRPADQASRPTSPWAHRLNPSMWQLVIGSQGRFTEDWQRLPRGSLL